MPNLTSCVQDATKFLEYISQHLNNDHYTLQTKSLFTGTPEQPTRRNIILGFKEHLGQAQKGDMVLIFYAGHGSKTLAPSHFLETDGYLQTLVPSDARQIKNNAPIRNILDLEIRFLLQEIWEKSQAEIIFVQDSCHATGSTRQTEQLKAIVEELQQIETHLEQAECLLPPIARYLAPDALDQTAQQWEQLSANELAQHYTAFAERTDLLEQLQATTVAPTLPLAPHIHLAACDKAEFAYEIPHKGGVFSTHLLEILEAAQNSISYHDLFHRIRLNIAGVYQQMPDLFVHHQAFEKRHQPFLKGLLQQTSQLAHRDIDVFNGFYPVVPKGRKEWQIKAGAMDLLQVTDNDSAAIPIEIFLQDQQPTGHSNAYITKVYPSFSKIELQGVSFDRTKHRNQLYAMIAPHFLRRWRVSAVVEKTAQQGDLVELFEQYGPRKQLKNFRHDGGAAIRIVGQNQQPHFTLKAIDNWLHLYNAQQKLVLRGTAAQRQVGTEIEYLALSSEGNSTVIYQYLPHSKKELQNPSEWSFSPYQKNALVAIFNYLTTVYKRNPQESILVQLEETTTQEHPFINFLEQEATTLDYFEAFIHWKTEQKEANYLIRTSPEGFSIHHQVNGQATTVPVCLPTIGLGKQQGFEVILALQHICKWQTVRNWYNKMQHTLLHAHQFQLEVSIYPDFEYNKNTAQKAVFQSFNAQHYQNKDRGLSHSLHELTTDKKTFHFVQHPQYPSVVALPISLVLHHLEGDKNVYISTLLLNSNFAILPLQTAIGNDVVPPQKGHTNQQGSLWISNLHLPRPEQLKHFPKTLNQTTFYLKILIAYERFDVSSLLQHALKPAVPLFASHSMEQTKTRSKILHPPQKSTPHSWIAFTIPIVIHTK